MKAINGTVAGRKLLIVLSVLVVIGNMVVFWPNFRKYTDVVAEGYEAVKAKGDPFRIGQPKDSKFYPEVKSLSSSMRQLERARSSEVKEALDRDQESVNQFDLAAKYRLENDSTEAEPVEHSQEAEEEVTQLPYCPDIPPDLVGALAGLDSDISKEEVEAKYVKGSDNFTPMEMGGKCRPRKCRCRQKLAIIIPYRNRYEHLHILLNNLIPILRRQQRDFQIFVMEQNMPTVFNRGMLFNVGFLEALKFQKFDCFVFHDVDMLPLNDHAMYTCKANPVHMAAWTSKWSGTGLPYRSYFGGVVMFSREQYQKINGDSNLYFGWGGEDDDLWTRVKFKGYTPIRFPQKIARYKMIKHTRDSGNEDGTSRFDLLLNAKKRVDTEGLNSTDYTVTQIELLPLYTWIKASLDKKLTYKNGTAKQTPSKLKDEKTV